MQVTVQLPDEIAKRLGDERDMPRRMIEALLVDECARGRISRGKVAEILGLSFHEAEELFQDRRVPYPIKSGVDDAFANASLPKTR